MKKLSRKSVLLFGVVLAVCAFAAPMASGASWSLVNSTHVLSSLDLRFTVLNNTIGSSCADSEFHAVVVSAAVMKITGASFRNCTGSGNALGCTTTATGTNFPWTATATATDNIQIHGVDVDVRFENHPIDGACPALVNNVQTRITGTLTGGSYDPAAIAANRRITFQHDDGLTSHSSLLGAQTALVTGEFRDTTGTLNVLM